MSLDLRLLIVEDLVESRPFYAHSILTCRSDSRLFEKILLEMKGKELRFPPPTPQSPKFTSFVSTAPNGECGYGPVEADAYGEPLQFVAARLLVSVLRDHLENPEAKWRADNFAILAFLSALPGDSPIALFWC